MATEPKYPSRNGRYYSFCSIKLKAAGRSYIGFKSINYSRKRDRGEVRGAHPDPIAQTQGDNSYTGDCEMYLPEFNLLMADLGAGYGDVAFDVTVTYSENGFDTIQDELIGCHLDSTDASNGQGTDPTVRKFELNPIKILFNGEDDVDVPLGPPAG